VLVGREPRQGFPFSADASLPHTIGNYWPYATTVFDYIRRAMPPDAPGSLSDTDVYNLTAFLLRANDLIPDDAVVDAASLPKVEMPAKPHFVPDTRKR
jgi:cytochrome c